MVLDELIRFALPVDKPVLLDDDGFLLAPSDPRWKSGDATPPTLAAELPADRTSFVLLAAGGAGKTVTFEGLAEVERDARRIDTSALTIEGLERDLDEACFHSSAVYLDGLDQVASIEPRLFPWLERYLTAPARREMRWRLACRAVAWDTELGQALLQKLPAFTTWKLAPIDRDAAVKAVERAIESPAFSSAAFIQELIAAGMGRLSGCVGQLIAVARYRSEQGQLPRSAVDAIDFEIEYLLRETGRRRRPRLPMDRSKQLARRLGAFTMFAGTQALTVGALGDRATLPAHELPSDPEPDQPGRSIEPDDYRAVLDTALFDSGPAGSVVFRHQRYLEYLAAAYLAKRGIRAGQVPVLLGVHPNGLLPAARIGVASWLAALAPDLVSRLFVDNAAMFASAAALVELPSDEARAALVAGLLEASAQDEAEPDWQLDRSGLIHDGLAEQLTGYIERSPANTPQLWWIARLAAAGNCGAIAPALARAALEQERFGYARRAAVAAVAVLGDEKTLLSLRELLVVPDGADPDADNEVRAAVIDALYPRLLSITELTQALRPHRAAVFGGYRITLRDLPGLVPQHDFATFVAWLGDYTWQTDSSDDDQFDDLRAGVIERAWRQVDDEGVRSGLARLLVALIRSGRWYRPANKLKSLPWVDGSVEHRRALALEAAALDSDTWYAALTLGLLASDDGEWLLSTLPSVSPQAAGALTNCLPQLLHNPSAALADSILELTPDHPGYPVTAFFRGSVRVDDKSVQHERHMAAEGHKYQRELAARQERIRGELRAVLADLVTEPESWWRVPWLLINGDGTYDDIEEATAPDLTCRAGWAHLGTDEQRLVLVTGLVYLRTHQPSAHTWWTAKEWGFQAVMPDWSGVYLLTTLAEHIPKLLDGLTEEVWARWMPSIVATQMYTGGNASGLRRRLLDAVPASAREHLVTAALEHLAALVDCDGALMPSIVYEHLANELAPTIAEILVVASTATGIVDELLTLVVRHGPSDIALTTCRRLVEASSPLAPRARAHLAQLDPDSVIDMLFATSPSPGELAESVQNLNVALLDPARLTDVARLLLDCFPYTDEPTLASGFTYTPMHGARDTRRHVLERMALNGLSEEIEALSAGRPDFDRQVLARHRRIARSRQADLSLGTTQPHTLLGLLRRGDARLVRSDADLQHVVLQELDELQRHFAGAWRDIWKDNGPWTEDDISDWIERRFTDRLRGVIVNREVQVSRDRPGIGTRIDLTVIAKTAAGDKATVLIEAKRVDNSELLTAMQDQLIDRYLSRWNLRYGIYLVYWITPTQRPTGWSKSKAANKAILARDLEEQAERAAEAGFRIVPYILDISRP